MVRPGLDSSGRLVGCLCRGNAVNNTHLDLRRGYRQVNYSNNLKGSTHLGLRHWQPDLRPERLLTPPLGALSPIAWDRTILPGNACFLACFVACLVFVLPALLCSISSHFACFLACFILTFCLLSCLLCFVACLVFVLPVSSFQNHISTEPPGPLCPLFLYSNRCNKQRCPGGRFDHQEGGGGGTRLYFCA